MRGNARHDSKAFKKIKKRQRLWMQVRVEALPIEAQVLERVSLHIGERANYIGDEHNVYIT